MSACDAEVRKILYNEENANKKNKVPKCDSYQSRRKRAKDPTPSPRSQYPSQEGQEVE